MKWQRDVESTILDLLTAVVNNRHVGDCVWNDCMVWNLTATWCNNWVFCTQMFAYPWENISCHLFCRKTDISLWISLYLVSEVAVADKKGIMIHNLNHKANTSYKLTWTYECINIDDVEKFFWLALSLLCFTTHPFKSLSNPWL